jgi:hypothetical protein
VTHDTEVNSGLVWLAARRAGIPTSTRRARRNLPSLLGVIESIDSGESWEPISLLGEADFHVLRFAGERVYGYDASNDRLLVSADRGRTWKELEKPGPLVASPSTRRMLAVSSRRAPAAWRKGCSSRATAVRAGGG